MYDFSTAEKIIPKKYHVRVFNVLLREEAEELSQILENPNIEVTIRNDYFSQENDSLYVHIEWKEYMIEKISPFSEDS